MSWEYNPEDWYPDNVATADNKDKRKYINNLCNRIKVLERQVEYWKARAHGRFATMASADRDDK